jgi:hypothetical protein
MCTICNHCVKECYCPRCPFRTGEVTYCSFCGLDDRLCKNPVCAITEHYMASSEPYCQLCVESQHKTCFEGQQLGMYCATHEQEHKQRSKNVLFDVYPVEPV